MNNVLDLVHITSILIVKIQRYVQFRMIVKMQFMKVKLYYNTYKFHKSNVYNHVLIRNINIIMIQLDVQIIIHVNLL